MAKERGNPTAKGSVGAAARYVRRGANAIQARGQRIGKPINRGIAERFALSQWAELNHKRLSFEYIEQFNYVASGAEHRVYHDGGRLAIKATHPNSFGHSTYGEGIRATPGEYLRRLAWCNLLFGDSFEILGVAFDEEDQIEVISSQPWIDPHPIRSVPFAEEIDAYFYRFGFFRTLSNPDAPLFYHLVFNLLVADAHDTNILRDENGEFSAIDVVVGPPGPALYAELRKSFAFAQGIH